MNIETVRSLTEAIHAMKAIAVSKGDDRHAFRKFKLSMQDAIRTEQDLRNAEFMQAVQGFNSAAPEQEFRSKVVEVKKPVQPVPAAVPVKAAATSDAAAFPPAKAPNADLTSSKSGIVK